MKKYKVYYYTFPDGKRYVGHTGQTIATRMSQARKQAKAMKVPINKAITKFGLSKGMVSIECYCDTKREALTLEAETTIKYRSNEEYYGYNVDCAAVSSAASIEKIKKAKRLNGGGGTTGYKYTPQQRKNMSIAQKGMKKSAKHRENQRLGALRMWERRRQSA